MCLFYLHIAQIGSCRQIERSPFLRLFVDHIGIDPRTLKATGYAEFDPAAGDSTDIKRANDTETKRAKNRRIEIVLVYSETEGSQ